MSATLVDLVRRVYRTYAGSPAVLGPTGWWSFADLARQTARVAHGLAQAGVRRGDRVVYALDNRPESVALDHAIWLLGAVRVALSARLHDAEVARIAEDCEARVVVREVPDGVGTGLPEVDVRPDDVAALMYTSGSTGRPKGAIATHRAWTAMLLGLAAELPVIGPGDVVLHAAPMSHFGGAVGHACSLRGAATVTMSRFDPAAVLNAVHRHGVTVLPVVPTMLRMLVERAEPDRPRGWPSLRAIAYGGSATSPDLLRRAGAVFGEVLYQFYGSSEAMVPITALSARDHRDAARLSSAGRPTPLADLRVDAAGGEVGEILVRGETVAPGYWHPEPSDSVDSAGAEAKQGSPATNPSDKGSPRSAVDSGPWRPDGWFATGDLGFLDDAGYLHVVDRARERIVTGGFSVYPREVERVIETLDAVAEVAVVGVPHERWGEGVAAIVVERPERTVSARDVVEVCRANLADFKKPVHVEIVAALPHTSTGKLDRSALRQRFWSGHERQVGVS